jgi:hypothetical protein
MLAATSNPPFPDTPATFTERYRLTDLGQVNGLPLLPVALNDRGQVAVYGQPPEAQMRGTIVRGFLRDGGRLLEHAAALGGVPVAGLSANGLLCGQQRTGGGPLRAWALHLGDLGAAHWPDCESSAIAVNARGQVAGHVTMRTEGSVRRQAFLSDQRGGILPISVPRGGSTIAAAMNDAGAVLLNSSGGGFEIRSQAWLWRDGHCTLIPGLPGGGTWGEAVTPEGRVAGRLRTSAGHSRAFLHEHGRTHDLNHNPACESEALAANDQRVVVGRMMDAAGRRQAFRWTPADGMRALAELVPEADGWEFLRAVAVNAAGQIAGRGLWQGTPRGFLLTPAV